MRERWNFMSKFFEKGSQYIALAGLKLSIWTRLASNHKNPLVAASLVLGLKVFATISGCAVIHLLRHFPVNVWMGNQTLFTWQEDRKDVPTQFMEFIWTMPHSWYHHRKKREACKTGLEDCPGSLLIWQSERIVSCLWNRFPRGTWATLFLDEDICSGVVQGIPLAPNQKKIINEWMPFALPFLSHSSFLEGCSGKEKDLDSIGF